ncbi:extracellular solute-binding protein [Carnobacterium maltaromaticum]|uniref:extracellular solute-binding protein n=1 Tax=Carnobacterium maltaromaticum TaxID=2751 RepID=UPI00295F28DA|nr:extracellular solute-binding protein [Carnobacterium maltaromaticum]
MKLNKVFFGIISIVLVAFLVVGCSGSKDEKGSGDKVNEIVFWNPFTGADGSNMQKMIAAYNKTNPDFKVKNVSLKEGDMYTKIPTVVNSGKNIPDVNIVHAERITQYKDNDMLVTYDELLKNFPEIKADNYVPEAWSLGEKDGSRYSLPLDIHSWGTYYNKDLLDKYLPDALEDNILTFDEIEEASKAAKKDDIRGLAITWMKPNFLSLYAQNGGELSSDGNEPTLDNQAAVDTLDKWYSLSKGGLTTKDGEDPTQLFVSNKLLFFPEGIWIQNNIKDADINWGFTNSPQLSDDLTKAVNWSSSHQFVMFKNKERSKEKEEGVVAFIDWLRDNSLEWAKAGQNPATLSLLDNQEYLKMPQSFYLATPEQQTTLKIFDYKYNGYVSEFLDANALDAVFGKVPVKETVKNMQKEVSDKVAKDTSSK